MENKVFNEVNKILEIIKSNEKTLNNKENELKQTVFVQNERVKEVREQLQNKNEKLTNNNNEDIKIFEEIKETTNVVIEEINKQNKYEEDLKRISEEKETITKAYNELSTYLNQKNEKYQKLQEEKAKYENIANNPNMSPELKLMYENKIGIIGLNMENIEITLNQKLDKIYRKLPNEIVTKIENEIIEITEEKKEEIKPEPVNKETEVEKEKSPVMNLEELREEVAKNLGVQEENVPEANEDKKETTQDEQQPNENEFTTDGILKETGIETNNTGLFSKVKSIKNKVTSAILNAFYSAGATEEYDKEGNIRIKQTYVMDQQDLGIHR